MGTVWRRCLALAAAALVAGALAAIVRRVERLEITGESMLPLLLPGDRVLVLRGGRTRPGDLVALADPRQPSRVVVKRLAGIDVRGGCTVLGDNMDASTDSRHYGPVSLASLQGPVFYRYFPERRRGWLKRRSTGTRW